MASGCGLRLGLVASSSRTLASLWHDRHTLALLHARELRQAREDGHIRLCCRSRCPVFQAAAVSWRAIKCSAVTGVAAALREEEETANESKLVEIGFVADTHGVHGELRVQSKTDFPQDRFGKPGLRWLRLRWMSKERLIPVHLMKGREAPGKQPSWLVSLEGVTTPEQASELCGATMLADADSKPDLVEGEFYIPDMIGMIVVLQESGEEVGVIEDVFNCGASDLLRVRLLPASDAFHNSLEEDEKGRLVWIPFVNEIVPRVDTQRRRIEITPPAGLLQLNVRVSSSSKKEARKQEIREERKAREVLAAIKKKLLRLGQDHVLVGLSSPDTSQKKLISENLFGIDFSQFEQALIDLKAPKSSSRDQEQYGMPSPPPEFPTANWQGFQGWLGTVDQSAVDHDDGNSESNTARWWRKGLQLVAQGRVAAVVLAGGQGTRLGSDVSHVKGMLDIGLPVGKTLFQLQAERLLLVQELASSNSPDGLTLIPWIVMTSEATDDVTRTYFQENSFFGLEESQVWFMKQDSLPCVDSTDYKILMQTPTKVSQAPNGNGGLFHALGSQRVLERLVERGIEYVQVYAVDNALVKVADPVFYGFSAERKADVGVKVVTKRSSAESVGVLCLQQAVEDDVVSKDKRKGSNSAPKHNPYYTVLEYSEMPEPLQQAREGQNDEGDGRESRLTFRAAHICVNMFSVNFLTSFCDAKVRLGFHAAQKRIPHMKQTDGGEWIQVNPEKPNGIKFEQFIFDAFRFSDPEKVALLEVKREEEFAPIKNACGPGVPDSPSIACEMALGLYKQLASECRHVEAGVDRRQRALIAYAGGLYGVGPRLEDFDQVDVVAASS